MINNSQLLYAAIAVPRQGARIRLAVDSERIGRHSACIRIETECVAVLRSERDTSDLPGDGIQCARHQILACVGDGLPPAFPVGGIRDCWHAWNTAERVESSVLPIRCAYVIIPGRMGCRFQHVRNLTSRR